MNLAACASLPRTPENSVWYRATSTRYLPWALSSTHTAVARSRFNAGLLLPPGKQFESLYFAGDYQTALFEARAMLGDPAIPGGAVSNPTFTPVILNVTVVLREVADLSTAAAQASLDITAEELTGDWVGYQSRTPYTRVSEPIGIAPTQELGEALFQTGVEGFRSVSARVPFNRTLVVFTTNLRLGSSVVFADDRGTVQRINGTRA